MLWHQFHLPPTWLHWILPSDEIRGNTQDTLVTSDLDKSILLATTAFRILLAKTLISVDVVDSDQ